MEQQPNGKKTSSKDYEDKCLKCGKCCRVVLEIGEARIPMKCEFINDRPEWCLNPKQMEEKRVMPILCGYRKKEVN